MSEANEEQAAKLNREGKFREALELVAPLVEKGFKQPNAYLQMSSALRGLNDNEAARKVELRAIELFPGNPHVAAYVGNLLATVDKKYAKAAELVCPLLADGQNDPDLFSVASLALRALKRNAEADAIELKGLAEHPNHVTLLARRAAALNTSNDFNDVISLLAGKDSVVATSPALRANLQRAKEGLAPALEKPQAVQAASAAANPTKPAPEASPSKAPALPHPMVLGAAPSSAADEPVKERPRPAEQSAPAPTEVGTASLSAALPGPAHASIERQQSTKTAALDSIPTVPTPAAPSHRPLAQTPHHAALDSASQTPELQQTAPKTAPTPNSSASSAASAIAARATKLTQPAAPATAARPQQTVPLQRTKSVSAADPGPGMSAIGIILWGLVIVAAGLLVGHFAGQIDLTPFAEQVSALVETARGK